MGETAKSKLIETINAIALPYSKCDRDYEDGIYVGLMTAKKVIIEGREESNGKESEGNGPINTRQTALDMVNAERNRQDAKWGEQDHGLLRWNSILGEEVGEVSKAVNQTVDPREGDDGGYDRYDRIMEELTQVAAVAVCWMECLMRAAGREGPEPFDMHAAAHQIEQTSRDNLDKALTAAGRGYEG